MVYLQVDSRDWSDYQGAKVSLDIVNQIEIGRVARETSEGKDKIESNKIRRSEKSVSYSADNELSQKR